MVTMSLRSSRICSFCRARSAASSTVAYSASSCCSFVRHRNFASACERRSQRLAESASTFGGVVGAGMGAKGQPLWSDCAFGLFGEAAAGWQERQESIVTVTQRRPQAHSRYVRVASARPTLCIMFPIVGRRPNSIVRILANITIFAGNPTTTMEREIGGEMSMSATKTRGAWLRRMIAQQMILRQQWAQRDSAAIEYGREGVREGRPHADRRRFGSDAQLRADNEQVKREWVNSSPPRKRRDT
jgi:hypothetical protein